MSEMFKELLERLERPLWPPLWNPFEVFILVLAVLQSPGLVGGHSGSQILDGTLSPVAIVTWGFCLWIGAAMALFGLWCYRRFDTLMIALHLERAGLVLVGVACAIYSAVIIGVVVRSARLDFNDVRWTVAAQSGFAAACFFRAWQDHQAIAQANRLAGKQPWRELWSSLRLAFVRSREDR